jgi:hypothetical protein
MYWVTVSITAKTRRDGEIHAKYSNQPPTQNYLAILRYSSSAVKIRTNIAISTAATITVT